MKKQEDIIARLGYSVVALASLCIVLAVIVVVMLSRKYTTDIEMASAEANAETVKAGASPDNYFPPANGPDGRKLFKQNCAVCHSMTGTISGPPLQGVTSRVPSEEWMHSWIKNPDGMKKSGDAYANRIDKEYASNMTSFSYLSDNEISAIIDYVKAAGK